MTVLNIVEPLQRRWRVGVWAVVALSLVLGLMGCSSEHGESEGGKSATGKSGKVQQKASPAKAVTSLHVVSSWEPLKRQLLRDAKGLPAWAMALDESAGYYAKRKASAPYRFGPLETTSGRMAELTRALAKQARKGDVEALFAYLEKHTVLMKSVGSNGQGNVLVTAYYEPLLKGSREQSDRYRYPLYKRPTDLLKANLRLWSKDLPKKTLVGRVEKGRFVPYHNREIIDDEGVLKNQGLELVWVDDLVDAFFLQIQGSGRVLLPDGNTMLVGYQGANGRAYRSIGKLLIEEGHISKEKMSLPALRKWLDENPGQVKRVLNYNPSYVFFRELDGGPYGNISVALTPGRSIATDYRLFPRGAPGVLVTELPDFNKRTEGGGPSVVHQESEPSGWRSEVRFIVNQDTGGAIRGPGRVDMFLGFGQDAEQTAGVMKQSGGALYFLAPADAKRRSVKSEKSKAKVESTDGFLAWLRGFIK
ncbi:MAG: murein transglycosylase A [Magnetococcales bacterium]|nr:murein transglycosylase A [Magnetococcales bacterium]